MTKKMIVLFLLLLLIVGCSKKSTEDSTDGSDNATQQQTNIITFAAEISGEGTGFQINDNELLIDSPGTYYLSGTHDNATITVDSTGEVVLVLANLTLSGQSGPLIDFQRAEKATVFLDNDSVNTLTTTSRNSAAVIYSNSTLLMEGNGKLILEGSGHGIQSDLHLSVNAGSYDINTVGYGLYSTAVNEGVIRIKGGYLLIQADDDAVHSEGSIVIEDGTILALSAEKSGIYANDPFHINGGVVLATGEDNSLPLENSAQAAILLHLDNRISSGYRFSIENNKNDLVFSYEALVAYDCILFSSNKLISEEPYIIYSNGTLDSSKVTNGLALTGVYEPGNLLTTTKPKDIFNGAE